MHIETAHTIFQVIPDEVCHKAGLSANWHSCNKFSVHAYRPVTTRLRGNYFEIRNLSVLP
jgi:hypothetical protein